MVEGQPRATTSCTSKMSWRGDGTTRGGDPDAVTHYSVIQSGLSLGDQEACVLGRASAGAAGERVGFFGCDAVTMKEAAHTAR
jgi:hypothetical protein